ncbi:hypothetical protein AAG596_01070 [Citromicrobium bathyomarinum]|uniref:hypothetical protein n=1 Tax=Citromicrobium bathyomarinum TaxID=72174 RepID=UPI003159D549
MAKKNAHLSNTANDNARKCPNSGGTAHTSVSEQAACLSPAQIRAAIAQADISLGSRLDRYARYRAWTANLDADDLLQEAILRAISSRKCPSHVPIEHFLMGIIRSIANAAIKRREREDEALFGFGLVAAKAAAPADELICAAERGKACRRAIQHVCEGDPLLEAVLDGIDQGLCGEALASSAEIDKAALATKRRLLKRRVTIEWGALADLDEAA